MITKYYWRTKKYEDHKKVSTTGWVGIFLFGFIPIYIGVIKKEWEE